MPDEQSKEPLGLGEHTRGLASEYAHEQDWGLNEEERRRVPEEANNQDGKGEYDYGARDFGDEALKVESTPEAEAKAKQYLEKGVRNG